jgi:ferric-dicitrate binding protein FerR (iron transport regulator)
VPVPKSETILSGDILATSDDGSALVELQSGAKLKITENSSVRFLADGNKVQAELLAGAVISESTGQPSLVVTTPKYRFEPSQEGPSRYAVALSNQQETFAGAVKGNLLVRTPASSGSYILPEGKYAAIPASSDGVPAREKAAGGPPAGNGGTVTEIPLKVSDGVNQEDIVRTLKTGRVRIALLDGSFLNVGAGSVMRITKQDASTQQTQVELTLGLIRAEVAKRTQPGGNFQVQTQTAIIGVVGSVLLVHAFPKATEVYCVEGLCSVQNTNPAIAGQVTLHAGEFTTIPRGLPPTTPVQTSPAQLQSQINQTNVEPSTSAASGPGGPGGAAKVPWHIGSLSEANSILLAAGIAAGTTAAVAVPVITSRPAASPSVP